MKVLKMVSLAAAAATAQSMPYLDFTTYMKAKDGSAYPSQYTGEGGTANYSLTSSDRITGSSLAMNMTAGHLYAQFNPYTATTRGFAREYVSNPSGWQYNTYNRMEFWIKVPTNGATPPTNGNQTYQLGTYVKKVAGADQYSDETGGGHFYHHFNAPNNNHWTKVILDMHPNHQRGGNGSTEWGVQAHPTGESNYNYFDALTRWYINDPYGPTPGAMAYKLDDIRFYKETAKENDSLYMISASYEPATHKTFIGVNAWKRNTFPVHEIRWSRKDIHANGWASATQVPNGRVSFPGDGGYNSLVYQNTGMTFNVGETIYFAIKPDGSDNFIQIALPILDQNGGLTGTTPPVTDPPVTNPPVTNPPTGCKPDTVVVHDVKTVTVHDTVRVNVPYAVHDTVRVSATDTSFVKGSQILTNYGKVWELNTSKGRFMLQDLDMAQPMLYKKP
jgi:hypothetical protein